ncbi:MAG TPA: hypothetical protein VES95_02295 [Dermatophilaceae bacterium]|nr:hypothetical protein [Dermatophilaceae bacterium]
MALKCQVVTGQQRDAGTNWYYWFYPHGGSYLTFPDQVENDPTVMTFAVRPNSPEHWFLKVDHVIVVTEKGPGAGRRHSYRVNVKNSDTQFARAFNLAAMQITA